MDLIELVLKEYDIASDRYKFFSEIKTKTSGIFITFFIVFLTFLVKGDLPQFAYLVLAWAILGFLFFNNYLSHMQITNWWLWQYTEHKLNHIIKEQKGKDNILDLGENTNRLLFRVYPERYLIKTAVIVVYIFFVWMGSEDREVFRCSSLVVLAHSLSYVALIALFIISRYQNRERLKNYNEIKARLAGGNLT